ncbi:hypothetical protein [Parageobacillus sp. KH3-4]|uniref:hypothetical protein n=1 Tax=Parageobacillus sp. KH3-4 TaxID=2916802 RepID=UPI001FCB22C7|nr:hypothetical protein [Parageobacillus sp. KH3-4]BDG48959.1 hypothetical protein PspKH34_35200 [Parageobacillus sp. KH3-4]
MEKETVRMKMKEILESSFSVPSLKEAVLTSIEEHTKQSDFLFGRLAGVHYQMFSENMKETETNRSGCRTDDVGWGSTR